MFEEIRLPVALAGLSVAFPAAPSAPASATRSRPPVIVSPDLSAPWVMQLVACGARPVVYRAARAAAASVRTYQRQVQQRPLRRRRSRRCSPCAASPRPNKPIRTQIDPIFLPQMVAYESRAQAGHHRHRHQQPLPLPGDGRRPGAALWRRRRQAGLRMGRRAQDHRARRNGRTGRRRRK